MGTLYFFSHLENIGIPASKDQLFQIDPLIFKWYVFKYFVHRLFTFCGQSLCTTPSLTGFEEKDGFMTILV